MSDMKALHPAEYLVCLARHEPDLLDCGVVLTAERRVDVWAANEAADRAEKLRARRRRLPARQREILRAVEEAGGLTRGSAVLAAQALGVSAERVRQVVRELRRKGLLS